MIGYASFAPIKQNHNKNEEGMYDDLKRQVFNMTHELHDTESTTYLAPTADNHLDLNDNTASITKEKDMQQQLERTHFQHKRQLKLQQFKEELDEGAFNEMKEQQHKHKHHRRHHHNHHHNEQQEEDKLPQNAFTTQSLESYEEQKHNEEKLLQHIAYKLQHEQRQLRLLHQQQQRAATFSI